MPMRAARSMILRSVSCLAVFSVFVGTGTSCGSCEAKCIGPAADITVANDVAAVEACDSTGKCTRQEFGPAEDNTFNRSFSFATSGEGSKVSLDVRTFLADGTPAASGHVEAKMSDGGSGSCGCKGPAKFYVSSELIAAS